MDDLRYLVYGRSGCEFCVRVCDHLRDQKMEFVYFDLTEDEEFLSRAKQFYNWQTVPIVVSNNKLTGETKLVGGCDDLCSN